MIRRIHLAVPGALLALALIVPASIVSAATQPAFTQSDINCSCVLYVRSLTGLPGGPSTAAGYTEAKMRSFGYTKVTPRAGAILVWDANKHGAFDQGHMAIITAARYDTAHKKWVISVRHSDWAIPKGANCADVAPRADTFTWGNLDGINAYMSTRPWIGSVSSVTARPDQQIVIRGDWFGSHAPYNGDSEFLEISDLTGGWNAGWHEPGAAGRDTVTLNVTSWSRTQIVVAGYTGDYGSHAYYGTVYDFELHPGDRIRVRVWNPQSNAGPAIFYTAVGG